MIETADQLSLKLENAYQLIERERMQDVPILHDALSVKAIGFRPHQGHWFGVMMTPWFMNLMIVPGAAAESSVWDKQVGDKFFFHFPAGKFEFIFGEDELVGKHMMCALYSPMFDFADQESAELTAQAVLEMVMMPKQVDELDIEKQNQDRLEEIWAQEDDGEDLQIEEEEVLDPIVEVGEDGPEDMSRRSFLRMGKEEMSVKQATKV